MYHLIDGMYVCTYIYFTRWDLWNNNKKNTAKTYLLTFVSLFRDCTFFFSKSWYPWFHRVFFLFSPSSAQGTHIPTDWPTTNTLWTWNEQLIGSTVLVLVLAGMNNYTCKFTAHHFYSSFGWFDWTGSG